MGFIQVAALSTGKSPATLSRLARIGASGSPAVLNAWEADEITEAEAAKTSGLPLEEKGAQVARLVSARVAAEHHAPATQPGSGPTQPLVETTGVGAVAGSAAIERKVCALPQEEDSPAECVVTDRGSVATQQGPNQVEPPTATLVAESSPLATSTAPADSEDALGERAIAALGQWSRAVRKGEGTEASLKQVSLGQRMLAAMVLILRPKLPRKAMASA